MTKTSGTGAGSITRMTWGPGDIDIATPRRDSASMSDALRRARKRTRTRPDEKAAK